MEGALQYIRSGRKLEAMTSTARSSYKRRRSILRSARRQCAIGKVRVLEMLSRLRRFEMKRRSFEKVVRLLQLVVDALKPGGRALVVNFGHSDFCVRDLRDWRTC